MVQVLVDGGVQGNFINTSTVDKLGLRRQRLDKPMWVRHSNRSGMLVKYYVPDVKLTFQNNIITACCIEVPELKYDASLGQAWHKSINSDIDWVEHIGCVDGCILKSVSDSGECNAIAAATSCDTVVQTNNDSCVESLCENKQSTVFETAPRYLSILHEFADVFANDLPERMASGSSVEHEIEREPGAAPPMLGLYRMSSSELQELKSLINDLLDKDFVTQSVSPFAAPILFVSKKDGSRRLL